MANKIEALVADLAKTITDQYKIEIIDCEYKKIGSEYTLTLFIDKEGGITLDDCEKVSRELEEKLDHLDPIENEYVLSVSSPGLDRALKTDKDYIRNIDKKIYIKTYRAINKKKEYVAVLRAYNEETVTIEELKGKKMTLQRIDIAVIKQHIDF